MLHKSRGTLILRTGIQIANIVRFSLMKHVQMHTGAKINLLSHKASELVTSIQKKDLKFMVEHCTVCSCCG